MKKKILTCLLLLAATVYPVKADSYIVTDTIFDRKNYEETFAFGADIGFLSQMESWGTVFRNKEGVPKDLMVILKELGVNALRFRVWVNPADKWCGKEDVVNMCKRAHKLGFDLMIDFHYSDTWADPGNQTIPAAWANHNADQLAQDVYNHTFDVLSAIKKEGIIPRWVQVGNETKRGMLYPIGQTNKGGSANFAKFVKSGYNAVKAVDSTMQVIVHLPEGHNNSLFRSIFDGLKKNGAPWDIIGLSAYPRWSHLDGPEMVRQTMANIRDLKSRYGKPVMVVEMGHYNNKPVESNQYLVQLMDELIKNGDLGAFYWEPEAMSGYELGAWDPNTQRPSIALDAYQGLRHREVSWLINANISNPVNESTIATHSPLTIRTSVRHIQNKQTAVNLFLDNIKIKQTDEAPFEFTLDSLSFGAHQIHVTATDTEGNSQQSQPTIVYVGRNPAHFVTKLPANFNNKKDSLSWDIVFPEAGKYELIFHYNSELLGTAKLYVNQVSNGIVLFKKCPIGYGCRTYVYQATSPGLKRFSIVASSGSQTPSIKKLSVLPLEGQTLPLKYDVNSIEEHTVSEGAAPLLLDIYSLTGVFLRTVPASEVNVPENFSGPAVMFLPNCIGGTPNIVRKHRLK